MCADVWETVAHFRPQSPGLALWHATSQAGDTALIPQPHTSTTRVAAFDTSCTPAYTL